MIAAFERHQGATQVRGHISFGTPRGNGVAQDLPDALLGSPRGFGVVLGLELPQIVSTAGALTFVIASLPISLNTKLSSIQNALRRVGGLKLVAWAVSHSRHPLKVTALATLFFLAPGARVDAIGQKLPSLVSFLARPLQGDIRIHS